MTIWILTYLGASVPLFMSQNSLSKTGWVLSEPQLGLADTFMYIMVFPEDLLCLGPTWDI